MTLPIVLTIAGCAALLVGLFGGGVKAKEIEVPKISFLPRVVSSLTGLALIGVAIWITPIPQAETPAAESLWATQMANNIWITQTAQSIEATKFAESIKATQTAFALNSNPTALQNVQATQTPYPTYTPPPTASPIVMSNTYNILQYGGISGTQRSTPLDYVLTVKTVDFLQIELSISEGACSDAFFHILWDNNEISITDHVGAVSSRYTTGPRELSQYISPGTHKLTISPEGVLGGCNIGTLGSWGGTLIVHTNEYP